MDTQAINTTRWWLMTGFGLCLVWCAYAPSAHAFDRRFALLVANQQGWKGDPKLQYVIRGDLRPMARRLRQIGFEVQTLENRDVTSVRRAFRELQDRLRRGTRITTFLFYYSGHADRNAFHIGPRSSQPMSFQEFASYLHLLPVMRRIAIIDSCYSGEIIRRFGSLQMYKKRKKMGQAKGVSRPRSLNIKKLLLPSQGRERGIRIISSSLHLAWELHRYKASIFTYHLLRGLNHAADLNRDGKITVDELFDYASREVKQETGQRPQQLVQVQREAPYALAPAYRSRLWIGSKVVGHLRVRVGNFVWSRHKKQKGPLRLAVIEGTGQVTLRRRGQCWKQRLLLQKHKEVRLSKRWRSFPCGEWKRRRKGLVMLPARVYNPALDPSYPTLVAPGRLHRFLGIAGGYTQSAWQNLRSPSFLGQFILRWESLQYLLRPDDPLFWPPRLTSRAGIDVFFPFRLGQLGADFGRTNQQEDLSLFLQGRVHVDAGLSIPLSSPLGIWNIYPYLAVYTGLSLIQYNGSTAKMSPQFLAGGAAGIEVTWWLSASLGFQLKTQLNLQYNHQDTRGESPFTILMQASLACVASL